jgi:riboflavin synthase
MFTGIVQAVGTVRTAVAVGAERRLGIHLGTLPGEFRIGDSIALSGVCCTVVALQDRVADFHLSQETLHRTFLGSVRPGDGLNLEGALRAGDPFGGHIVQGHVDGVGAVVAGVDPQGGGDWLVRVPKDLLRYCVEKGSITLDGVSLTIAGLDGDVLRIAIIPHTAQVTTIGRKPAGAPLHVEVDVLAKYIENMLAARGLGRA